jgi:hypothetical protein
LEQTLPAITNGERLFYQ